VIEKTRIIQAMRETQDILKKYQSYLPLPPESKLEQDRQKMIAFCKVHIQKLVGMMEAA
jgi:hypothetical protein